MDYVTRQFINLTKKLRKELRKSLSELTDALQKQTRAISDHYSRAQQDQNTQPPIQVLAELHTPEDIEGRRTANEDRHYRLQRWNTVGTWLAFFAVSVYAILTYFQLRDFDASVGISQILARQTRIQAAASMEGATAAKGAAETARDALTHVQRPWLGSEGTIKTESGVTTFIATVKNYGPAPALHVGVEMERAEVDVFEKKINAICRKAKDKTINGRYIIPGSTYDFTPHAYTVGAQPSPTFVYVGCIAYFGGFGKSDFHHTEFCLMKGTTADRPVVPCPVKQEAD